MDTWRSDVQTKILLKSLDATRGFILEDLDGDFLFITNDEATVCAVLGGPSEIRWIHECAGVMDP